MATNDPPDTSRLAALCSSLGRLTTEQQIENCDDNPSPFWLDFRYERLSHFCYSRGKLGHYAMNCKDIVYTAAETPLGRILNIPLLPPPSIIPADGTSNAAQNHREPPVLPVQQLQKPLAEHSSALIP